jgi:hypothetical protein
LARISAPDAEDCREHHHDCRRAERRAHDELAVRQLELICGDQRLGPGGHALESREGEGGRRTPQQQCARQKRDEIQLRASAGYTRSARRRSHLQRSVSPLRLDGTGALVACSVHAKRHRHPIVHASLRRDHTKASVTASDSRCEAVSKDVVVCV